MKSIDIEMLKVNETLLEGGWIQSNGRIISDEVSDRILWLTKNFLHKVAVDSNSGGWVMLYQDPLDERYWELSFPNSGAHAGGPPRLELLDGPKLKQYF